MSVIEAIRRRRAVGRVTDQVPTREQIETILEAGTHAPQHHDAEPWRFFVVAGDARLEIGELVAEALRPNLVDLSADKAAMIYEHARVKLLRAPVVIVAASVKPANSKIVDIENVAAVAAAVQNMWLAAQELGLCAIWRTGNPAYNPEIKAYLGLDPEEHIVAFLYLGYPAVPVGPRTPVPYHAKTRWLGWE
jgi:nitroreductase